MTAQIIPLPRRGRSLYFGRPAEWWIREVITTAVCVAFFTLLIVWLP